MIINDRSSMDFKTVYDIFLSDNFFLPNGLYIFLNILVSIVPLIDVPSINASGINTVANNLILSNINIKLAGKPIKDIYLHILLNKYI